VFQGVPSSVSFPALEQGVLDFWLERDIFRRSVAKPARGSYVFYEGPPTANGKPGLHHVISRAYKDLFPRYKTMQGYRVERKGGWDTHGLPVELEVEKRLGFTGKKDIEAYGIAEFNQLCQASAFEYIQDWNAMTERIGFWIDLDDPYITYDNRYIESCWWVLKTLFERGLLFEDYKVTMHCPRCNTSLADHEVSLGFQDEVDDPSVWPKFPAQPEELRARGIIGPGEAQPVYILAWTTTPWTLAANTALAVKADATYALVTASAAHGEEARDHYILAAERLPQVFGETYQVVRTFPGEVLVGLTYQPLLQGRVPAGEDLSRGYRVIADETVSLMDGTGVVHIAPAYGDLEIGKKRGLPTLFSVDLAGAVMPEVAAPGASTPGPYSGQFFKEADQAIIRDLAARGLLYRSERVVHAYPFCWRCDTPLLYYAKSSWYLRTTAVKDRLIANNQQLHWYPEHIRDGRFGKWLENNVDWAISRERYWGAPLPIWVSEDGQEHVCVGSVAELEQLTSRDLSGLNLHRPYVDELTFTRNGKTFSRLPYTVDVWFESGAMPYAQWHYPFENQAKLAESFPADFICEAIDQTRGWFYSLHALATLLTDSGEEAKRPPGALAVGGIAKDTSAFKHVICLGHITDEKGEKMSKSRGNAVDPWLVLNAQGADALRWYLYSSSPPGNSKRFSQALVEETLRDFFMTLWNSYSFFVLYANLDRPELTHKVPVQSRPDIDRWLVAKLHRLIKEVTAQLDAYDPTGASRAIRDFVVEDLSNWYVRRNRRRFWKSAHDEDKQAAYQTLYEALVTVSKLLAPLAPFTAEAIYRNLVLSMAPTAPESVHLTDWPTHDPALIDEGLLSDMNTLIRVVELGRAARAATQIKIRQPLPGVLVRPRSNDELKGLKRLEEQLRDELNVKAVTYLDVTADFVDYTVKPNLPIVGKRLGKLIPELKKVLAEIDGRLIARNIREGRVTELTLAGAVHTFEPEAFLIDAKSPAGYVALEDRGYLVALNAQLTPELVREGLAREVIRLVQNARKNAGLAVSDTIRLSFETSGELLAAITAHLEAIKAEVLATAVQLSSLDHPQYREEAAVDGVALSISLAKDTGEGLSFLGTSLTRAG